MKRPSPLIRTSSEADINTAMTPMIDVVFLLLVFFVWTASFQVVEFVLPSEMSAQMGTDASDPVDTPPPDDFEDVIVLVGFDNGQPNWRLNSQPVDSLTALGEQLRAIADIGAETTVILDPDPVVPLGEVIATYDTAKQSGFESISFAVTPIN